MVSRLIGQGVNVHGLVIDATDAEAVRAGLRTADKLSGGLTAVLYNAAKPYANTYAWFFHMSDGKVVKASAFFDGVVFNDLCRRDGT